MKKWIVVFAFMASAALSQPDEMPELPTEDWDWGSVREDLESGDSQERRGAIDRLLVTGLHASMEDDFLPAWQAAATDPSAEVRRLVAQVVGGRWMSQGEEAPEAALAIEQQLAEDESRAVRRAAVTRGLALAAADRPDMLESLLEAALRDRDVEFQADIVAVLSRSLHVRTRAQATLLRWMNAREEEPAKAMHAFELYSLLMGRQGPHAEEFRALEATLDPEDRTQVGIVVSASPVFEPLDAEALWVTVAENLSEEAAASVRQWEVPAPTLVVGLIADGHFVASDVVAAIQEDDRLQVLDFGPVTREQLEEMSEFTNATAAP